MTTLIILDFETSDVDIETAHIIEMCARLVNPDETLTINSLFGLPEGGRLSADAVATHRILPSKIEGKTPFKESSHYDELRTLLENPDNIVIGHNVLAFDLELLDYEVKARVIDTMKLSRHLAWLNGTRLKSAALQHLWATFALAGDEAMLAVPDYETPHRAGFDVDVSYVIFEKAQDYLSLDEMIEVSNGPIKYVMVPFGKFGPYGKEDPKTGRKVINWLTIKELVDQEPDYVNWLMGNGGKDMLRRYDGLAESIREAEAS